LWARIRVAADFTYKAHETLFLDVCLLLWSEFEKTEHAAAAAAANSLKLSAK
jgi:hypothetical protein